MRRILSISGFILAVYLALLTVSSCSTVPPKNGTDGSTTTIDLRQHYKDYLDEAGWHITPEISSTGLPTGSLIIVDSESRYVRAFDGSVFRETVQNVDDRTIKTTIYEKAKLGQMLERHITVSEADENGNFKLISETKQSWTLGDDGNYYMTETK